MTTEEILFYALGALGVYLVYRLVKKKMKDVDEKGGCSGCPMDGKCSGCSS